MIEKRIIDEAFYIVENKATVRQTAKQFGVSKSTVHKDVSKRLCLIDEELQQQVKAVLNENFEEKHIRGGLATREKYLKQKTK